MLVHVVAAPPVSFWSVCSVRGAWRKTAEPITAKAVSAAMQIQVSDAHLLGDLRAFLESAECHVRELGPGTLDVVMPRAPSPEQAEREVRIYLQAWQAMHPDAYARIVTA
jgi:hypothetical protein